MRQWRLLAGDERSLAGGGGCLVIFRDVHDEPERREPRKALGKRIGNDAVGGGGNFVSLILTHAGSAESKHVLVIGRAGGTGQAGRETRQVLDGEVVATHAGGEREL